jgi:transmembrane sensor
LNPTPDASDTEAQAAEWLIRLETDTSAATMTQWCQWLDEDARRRAAYLRLEHGWRHAECLQKLRPLDGKVNPDLLDTFPGLQPPGREQQSPAPPSQGSQRILATTLAITTAVLSGWLLLNPRDGGTPNESVHRTEAGGFERVVLPDGSTALLNTNTEMHVRFTKQRREVTLTRGEALFTAAHDESRPFEVEAGGKTVRALGTSFEVRVRTAGELEPGEVEVVVEEGRVAVGYEASGEPDSVLSSGEEEIFAAAGQAHTERMEAADIEHRLAWTHGQLWLKESTLAEAVAEFNRYNSHQFVLDDPSLATLRLGGSFSATDPSGFVAALGRVFSIRAVPDTDAHGKPIIRLVGPEQD